MSRKEFTPLLHMHTDSECLLWVKFHNTYEVTMVHSVSVASGLIHNQEDEVKGEGRGELLSRNEYHVGPLLQP